jgi:hypothetical protein
VTFSALTAGLNRSGGTTVKVQGICARDRSVRAERSHILIAYPSVYILLCACQGIVGHREAEFDFHPFLSQIFPYVTSTLICLLIGDPEASLLFHTQVVQQLEEHIKIWTGFYPNDALGGNIDADLLDHHARQILAFFFGRPFPTLS